MAVVTTNLGTVTAYGDAVAAGYTGTKAQWQALMADYATVGTQAAQSAQTASTAATTATTAAQTATAKASEASASATAAEQAAASIETPDTTLTQSGKAADAKATGDAINTLYVTDSASGAIAHLTDGADGVPMKSVEVNITPLQSGSGTPSPSNVRPISGWDSVTVTRSGKNLLQCPTSGGRTNSGITWTYNSDGSVTANGTATGNSWSYTNPATVTLPQGTYTVSVTSPFGMVVQNLTDGGYIHNGGYSQVTFTLNKLTSVGVHARVGNGTTIDATTGIQIEVGTEATEFESYNGNTYTISLSSAGTVYNGTLDVTSGVLTVDKQYEEFTGASSENWQYLTGSFGARCGIVRNSVLNTGNRVEVISNEGLFSANANSVGTVFASSVSIYYYPPETVTSVEGFKTWLASNPLQVIYPLATPLTYQLSAQEIKSFLGINNVWSDAGNMDVEYRADTKLFIERLTEPDSADMIADTNITSGKYFMVGNSLYKATANIANGGAIIVGTNCTRKSLSEALNEINA